MRSICIVVLLSSVFLGTLYAEESPKFKTVILPDAIRFVQNISEDKQVGTMIFDNFLLGTGTGKVILPSSDVKRFSYVLQPESTNEAVVTQHFRGFVAVQGTASAALLIQSGGNSTLVDLSAAIKSAKTGGKSPQDDLHQQARKTAAEQGFTVSGRPEKANDYFVEVKTKVAAGKPLQTTILLLVDRLKEDDGSGAVLFVDSVDFRVEGEKSK